MIKRICTPLNHEEMCGTLDRLVVLSIIQDSCRTETRRDIRRQAGIILGSRVRVKIPPTLVTAI